MYKKFNSLISLMLMLGLGGTHAQVIADGIPTGIKVYVVGADSSYDVYGGDIAPIDDDSAYEIGFHPEENGYDFLGSANSTHEFYGSYFYYLVRSSETDYGPVQVDAFELLGVSDCFWDPIGCNGPDDPLWYAWNFWDPPCEEGPISPDCPLNCQGPPDGEYSCLYAFSLMSGMICEEPPPPPPEDQPPVASFKSLNVIELGRPGETTREGYHMVGGVIRFDPTDSYDPDGGRIQPYKWDFDGGWQINDDPDIPDVVFKEARVYTITLVVIDDEGSVSEPYTKTLDLSLQEGDLIFLRSAWWTMLFPGNTYTHVGMYIGNQQMIESIITTNPRSPRRRGVVITPLSRWAWPFETYATLVRVRTANTQIIGDAIGFARTAYDERQQYDRRFWQKSLLQRNYYCSELLWMAYYRASNGDINLGLQLTGDPWDSFLPVWPDDIETDFVNCETIGGHYEVRPL